MVGLLWLGHEQACEADLAKDLDRILAAGELPDLDALRARFAPGLKDGRPDIPVHIPPAGSYDALISRPGAAA